MAIDKNADARFSDSEAPMYCKYVSSVLDEKAPSLVQGGTVCPDEEAMFAAATVPPFGWGIRVMFDELLDGDKVETLENCNPVTGVCTGHIDSTQPVTVTCDGATMTYDGYYYPNGNRESFPLGPSIVVYPDDSDTLPAGADCTVAINPVVVDKTGNAVATGANSNSFAFKVADIAVLETDPPDAEDLAERAVLAPDDAVTFLFNAYLDDTSFGAGDFDLVNITSGTAVAVPFTAELDPADPSVLAIFGDAPLAPGQYAAKVKAGATLSDLNGGSSTIADEVQVRFVVE